MDIGFYVSDSLTCAVKGSVADKNDQELGKDKSCIHNIGAVTQE
jgi:hypothetical protein